MQGLNRSVGLHLALLVLAVAAAGCATVSRPAALSAQVERARSPAEHLALAHEYDILAGRARAEVQKHKALLAAYSEGTQYRWIDRVAVATEMRAMPRHCEQLVRNSEEVVRIYEEMAREHRQWGGQSSPGSPE